MFFILISLSFFFFPQLNFFRSQMYFFFLILFLFLLTFCLFLFMLLLLNFFASELKVESCRQLEIQLNCSALMFSSEHIEQFDIDFRAVESSISFIQFIRLSELFKSSFQLRFSLVPIINATQILLRSCGELKLILEPKNGIDVI